MTLEERWKMLAKEQIKMEPTGEIFTVTKEDEIRGLKSLIDCIRHFEDLSEEELQKMFEEGMNEINEKYVSYERGRTN